MVFEYRETLSERVLVSWPNTTMVGTLLWDQKF